MTANTSRDNAYDVVIVGGGLAGQLCVHALAARAPSLRVAVVDKARSMGGNHTWCCHASDLAARSSAETWFESLVDSRWPGYHVSFPGFERTVGGDYLCLRSSSLASASERVMKGRGWVFLGGESVEGLSDSHVKLSSGTTLNAHLVLDARGGSLEQYAGRAGYQKFVGWEIEVEERGELAMLPLLMDATVEQVDGYRFVYVLPFSPTRFLVEDTYFSRDKRLDVETVRERLGRYLQERGIRRYTLVREEAGVLPMPWSKTGPGDALAIGYRGGFFHPATGYSLPRAVIVADALADVAARVPVAGLAKAAKKALAGLRSSFAANDRFGRLLNRLAFRVVPPTRLRDGVFAYVYELPAAELARFYAGRSSLRDRISLAMAPSGLRRLRYDTGRRPLLGQSP